jgi:hypothetical protein
VDEQKKLLELEAAIAKFETILHQSNAEGRRHALTTVGWEWAVVSVPR